MNDVIFSEGSVKQSSKDTHRELERTGKLSKQEEQVRQALKDIHYFPTRNELKQEMLPTWEKSTISGRVKGLIEKGVVEVLGKRPDQYADHNQSVEVIALTEELNG